MGTYWGHHFIRYINIWSLFCTSENIYVNYRWKYFFNLRNNKCYRGRGEKGILVHHSWKCKSTQPLWEMAWRFLKILKIDIPYDTTFLLLGIYPKKIKPLSWRNIHTTVLIAAFFITVKVWKQPKCPLMFERIKYM